MIPATLSGFRYHVQCFTKEAQKVETNSDVNVKEEFRKKFGSFVAEYSSIIQNNTDFELASKFSELYMKIILGKNTTATATLPKLVIVRSPTHTTEDRLKNLATCMSQEQWNATVQWETQVNGVEDFENTPIYTIDPEKLWKGIPKEIQNKIDGQICIQFADELDGIGELTGESLRQNMGFLHPKVQAAIQNYCHNQHISLDESKTINNASVVLKDLEEVLQDPVTFDVIADPYVIECGHSVGKESLDLLMKSTACCPLCNKKITPISVKSSMLNSVVTDVYQKYAQYKKPENK